MTPDEYHRIIDIFERVRDLPEREHAAALDIACAGQAGLREQVSRLLGAERNAEGKPLLGRRAIEDIASMLARRLPDLPSTGSEIGNYRLGPRIGAGGMGVVFEGLDLRLQRRVAVKVLNLHLAEDNEEGVKRFQREARAAS